MIIPSQHASRVARAAAGGGGGGDVTPNAVNWTSSEVNQTSHTTMLQITGITSTITLRVTFDGNLYMHGYSINSSATFGSVTNFANNGTLTVSNNEYLGFQAAILSDGFASANFTITNVSDSDAVLDTFQLNCFFGE